MILSYSRRKIACSSTGFHDPSSFRPRIEALEPRLPPGDAVLGVLLAWPGLAWETDDLAHAVVSVFDRETEDEPAVVISPPEAVPKSDGAPTTSVEPTLASTDTRAAGLIPAVRTAGINPAARYASSFSADGPTSATALAMTDSPHAAERVPALAVTPFIEAGPATTRSIGSLPAAAESPNSDLGTDAQRSEVLENYGDVPLSFEANYGQTDSRVDFIARTGDATVFLTPTAAVFSISQRASVDEMASVEPLGRRELPARGGLTPRRSPEARGAALYMQIVGANPTATPIGQDRQPGIVNYFIGNDPNQWHANIPNFARVEYQDVYPGIDLVYYGNDGQLEYDFIVSPGADPNAITLNFAGADGVEINPQGDLVLHTAAGDVVQQKPYLYQDVGDVRKEIAGNFALSGTPADCSPSTAHCPLPSVHFDVGAYNPSRPLIIDPVVLGYSTYLGGSTGNDSGTGIAVDSNGSAYVTGTTNSSNFPATPGAFDATSNGGSDVFVTKLNAAASALAYSTFIGGIADDTGGEIVVDGSGNAYVTGSAGSSDFPTTPGAIDVTFNGGGDAFVTMLNAAGSGLAYSTFLGGTSADFGDGIAVDGGGKAYVTGRTDSTNFPSTLGAFDTTFNGIADAFVIQLDANGSTLGYSTFLGGSNFDAGSGIDVDDGGNAYVTGFAFSTNFPTTTGAFDTTFNGGSRDGFVTKLAADGSVLIYSSFLGGDESDGGADVAVDAGGNAYVTGGTGSINFPLTPGAFDPTYNGVIVDSFAAKLNAEGSALDYSTFLGEFFTNRGAGIAVDKGGNAYVVGSRSSPGLAIGPAYAYVIRLNAVGSERAYSALLNGSLFEAGAGIAVDAGGNAYVTGETFSTDFPTTPGAFKRRLRGGDGDAFVTKFVSR